MDLSKLNDKQIVALFKIAKNKNKGARALFKNPKAMISLRNALDARGLLKQTYSEQSNS